MISNRAYISRSSESLGDPIPLVQTKWADLLDETPPILKGGNERLDSPMYGVFRTPSANNIDLSSPLGMPIFAEAIEEMKDLDIAYSRNAGIDGHVVCVQDGFYWDTWDSGQEIPVYYWER